MSYKPRDVKDFDRDDLNIKSHLNISLDKSRINVSEALIQRTLDAINKQPSVSAEHEDNHNKSVKRVIPKVGYLRSIAGIAAAVLVCVAGVNVFKALEHKDMKNYSTKNDSAPEIIMSSDLTEENAVNDKGTYNEYSMDDNQRDMDMADSNVGSEENNIPMAEKSASKDSFTENNTELKNVDDGKIAALTATGLDFREIIPVELNQLEHIRITNSESGASILLKDSQSIVDFYTLMQSFTFTEASVAEATVLYEVEVKEKNMYMLQIGDAVAISSDDVNVEDVIYNVSDGEAMLQTLSLYFQ